LQNSRNELKSKERFDLFLRKKILLKSRFQNLAHIYFENDKS
jgi:hypothetical protein